MNAQEWLDSRNHLTDHADAACAMLEEVCRKLKGGASPEDVGPSVILIGRMMARRT